MNNRIFHTPYLKVYMDDNSIINYKNLLKINLTYESAKKEIELSNKFGNGKKASLLVNLKSTKSIIKDARDYYSRDETAKVVSAVALIENSPLHGMRGNFFLHINKPSFPAKLISSEKEVIEWLKGHQGEENDRIAN